MLFRSLAIAFAVLTVSTIANAGDRTPVTQLQSLPKAVPGPTTTAKVEGVSVDPKQKGTYIEAIAAKSKGYCFVSHDPSLMLGESMTLAASTDQELWHFVETDEGATLERIAFQSDLSDNTLRVVGRSSVKLVAVGRLHEIRAWGFRDTDGGIVLLAKGGDFGREGPRPASKEEGISMLAFPDSSCTFGATRLDAANVKTGGVALLRGKITDKTRFQLDVSVGKLSRDPEAMLSVRMVEVE